MNAFRTTGILALLVLLAIPSPSRAQAVGGAEKARPVAGDPGMSTMLVLDQPQFRVLRDYAEPGATRRMHSHDDATWHVLTLVTGQLRLTVDGEAPVDVTQGQVLNLKGGVKHTFTNTGAVTATIVEVFGKAPAPAAAAAAAPSAYGGDLTITPLVHSSVQLEAGGQVIQVDPWSRADLSRAKAADLILVTDDPIHHLDPEAIRRLRKPGAPVLLPAVSQPKFPEGTVIANGETKRIGGITVEAIAAYDIKLGEPSHPKGKANGYLVTFGGKRIYFAGVTECVPEMRALRDIDVAFVPMNLPLDRMAPAAAAECVNLFAPKAVYVYHYDQGWVSSGKAAPNVAATLDAFRTALARGVAFRPADWYPRGKN
jgi:L-ascorbate metabolism protein UlaG (beta-lactamase superfamily)/quercetin dioxygenase-like cupin family protein